MLSKLRKDPLRSADLLQERRAVPAGGPEGRAARRDRCGPAGAMQGLPGEEAARPEEAPGPGGQVHPEERQAVHGGQGLALVAAAGEGDAPPERAQDRGGAEGKSGEWGRRMRGLGAQRKRDVFL